MEQQSEVNRMNDLISRQAAIDALCKAGCESRYCGASCDDVKAIEQLPPAQPEKRTEERTETHARDCVSGVAAIIAAIEAVDEWDGGYNMQRANMIRDAIKALPSEQPQRMNGKWIDVTKTGGAELWKCSECGELELEDSYFCPNCGADMRGEQNGENS